MSVQTRGKALRNLGINFAVGAAVGATAAFIGIEVLFEAVPGFRFVDAHFPGLLVAIAVLALGLMLCVESLSPTRTAKLIGATIEEGDDLTAEMTSLRWQGVVTVLAGAELAILSFGTDHLTGESGPVFLLLLVAILMVQTWFNIRLWRRGDEFFRRILVEAAVASFAILQFPLLFWAAGARFGYFRDPTGLDIYVMVLVIYLFASGVVSFRRGYGVPAK